MKTSEVNRSMHFPEFNQELRSSTFNCFEVVEFCHIFKRFLIIFMFF
jgi:hypothetical protein